MCYETNDPSAGCVDESKAPRTPRPLDETVWRVAVNPDDPRRGPDHAPVTLVVFSDFECPYCRQAAKVVEIVRANQPEAVRVVWKDYPLPMHDRAEPAALFARAVRAQLGDDAFWKVHDRLFDQQANLAEDDLRTVAEALGADWEGIQRDIAARTHAAPVVLGRHEGARLDVDRTPTIFVNGRRIAGAPSVETLEHAVTEARVQAEARLEEGIPLPELYERLIEGGEVSEHATDLP